MIVLLCIYYIVGIILAMQIAFTTYKDGVLGQFKWYEILLVTLLVINFWGPATFCYFVMDWEE